MTMTTRTTTVDSDQAGRIDAVVLRLSETSHSQVKGLIDQGCVSINGQRCSAIGTLVNVGDNVAVRFDPTQRYREKKQKRWSDRTFTIVYEDDDLIVVDKAAGTLTVPTDNDDPNTLVERVSIYISHSRRARPACVVHRLDREVSGVLVFGKHQAIADALIEQFKQRKPDRVYAAIVAGELNTDEGKFDSHLATGNNLDRYVTQSTRNAERAITHYRVLKRMGDATLVEVRLETGKRNQIRVHFADVGHPVLGDPRYQREKAMHPRWIRKRMALHALSLTLEHPATGKAMSFETPLPAAMQKFVSGSR